MKIVHVVPHVNAEASGPSYSVPRTCESLAALGHDVELCCLAAGGALSGVRLDVHAQWPVLTRFAVSPSLAWSLVDKAQRVDIVHNHSLWSMANVASGWAVPGRKAKLVTSPRGTLSPWALSRARASKRLLWPLQRRALSRADLLHATSQVEYEEIRSHGFAAPVAILPNGIDLPIPTTRVARPQRTLLFLSRIHPIKAIDRLLQAWQAVQHTHTDWRLVVAGVGEPQHEQEVRSLAAQLNLQRVDFPGPVYGEAKSEAYVDADLFILPTHSENFGMVVAEALAHGCPAIVSRGAPWQGLETEDCGWWVDNDVATLAQTLDAAMQIPPERLAALGRNGRAWMEREYGWASIAQRLAAAYLWITAGGERPPWVRQD